MSLERQDAVVVAAAGGSAAVVEDDDVVVVDRRLVASDLGSPVLDVDAQLNQIVCAVTRRTWLELRGALAALPGLDPGR